MRQRLLALLCLALLTFAAAGLGRPPAAARAAAPYVAADPLGETPASGQGVFRFPQAITYTPGASAIFVGDQFSGVVQRFDRSGAWVSDVGAPADDRELGRVGTVGGVAADRDGHLFVLDSENDRVQVFGVADGAWLAAWGSTGMGPGQFRLGANTGAGGIAVDQPAPGAPAKVFIADQYNHRIQAFALERSSSRDPGHPVLPPGTASGDVVATPTPAARWGTFGTCETCLNYPQGVTVDPVADADGRRHVFVADDRNHRVVEFLPDGTRLRQVGTFGTGDGQLRFPYDVGIDARTPRQLYVADNNNHRVQAFDVATLGFTGAWGTFGSQVGTLAYVRAVAGLADDPAGGYAVTDTANNRVYTMDAAGRRQAVWGIAGRGPGYVTAPQGVAVDAAGRVHVADTGDERIERLDADGAYLGQTGYVSAASTFAAPGAGPGQFAQPSGVALDPVSGHEWIADTGNDRVQELTADGTFVQETAGGTVSGPRGIAVGPDGAVVVADTGNNRIVRRDPATGTWAPVDLPGTTLSAPRAVAVAPDGDLLVADTGADRILRVHGTTVTALPAPPGGLSAPAGVAASATAVFASDTGGDRVLRHDAGGWTVVGTEGSALGAFVAPSGLALDPAGRILVVADTGNNRLQRLTLAGSAPPLPVRMDVTVGGEGSGTVTSSPAGIACPTDCRQGFTRGSAVTLTAAPDPGSQFTGWSGACSGTGPCTVTIDGPAQVGATFAGAPPPAPAPAPAATPPPLSGPRPTAPRPAQTPDRTAPRLRVVRLRPRTFRPRRSGGLLGTAARRGTGGATLTLALTERATVRARVAGRSGRRWRTRSGVGRVALAAGRRGLTLSGRLAGRVLRRGRYRLTLVATDRAGNRSAPRTVTFVVR